MKRRKTVYIYRNQELIKKCGSVQEAASFCNLKNPTAVSHLLDTKRLSRARYVFTTHELTEEEIDLLPTKEVKERKGYVKIDGRSCRQVINNLQFEVDCQKPLVFHLERSKDARKEQLKMFIWDKLKIRWMTIDKRLSTLEKRFLTEIIDSL